MFAKTNLLNVFVVTFCLLAISCGGSNNDEDSTSSKQINECLQMQTGWIFCESFEDGNLDQWDDYDGNSDTTNAFISDVGPFNLQGNTAMEFRPEPPGPGGVDLVKVLPSVHDALYARWYVKWLPGFDFTAPNHGSGLHAGDRNLLGRSGSRPSDGDDWYTIWFEHSIYSSSPYLYSYYRGMYQDCANSSGSCYGDSFPCTNYDGSNYCTNAEHHETFTPETLVTDQWYCVEIYLDGGEASNTAVLGNGEMNFWLNGQEYGPWTDLWLRKDNAMDITILWINLYHHGAHADVGPVYDNIVVSTERIGC